MKKYINIILLLGVLLMALSCVGTEGLDEIPNGEICMSPVLSDMTKTRAGGATNPYPDGSSFGVFAYYSTATGGQKWSDEGESYFHNHQFKKQDGVCAGVDPVYWPLSGSLIFAGYSPYKAGADTAFDPATKTLTINDYTVDGTKDLMYFLPELSDGNYVGYDKSTASVPVKFHHALSVVSFEVKSLEGADVSLKSIKLISAKKKGDFNVIAGSSFGSWSNVSQVDDLYAFSGTKDLSTSPELFQSMVIPGVAADIIVEYEMTVGVNTYQRSVSIPADEYFEEWNIGKKYTYAVTLSSQSSVVIESDEIDASINHVYENGILVGSNLNMTINVSDDARTRIKDVSIEVIKDSDQKTYRTYSVGVLGAESINIANGSIYLPQGEYTIRINYNDGLESRTVTKVVSSPSPTYEVSTQYSKNKATISISSKVSISDNILSEHPISDFAVRVRSGGDSYLADWNINNLIEGKSTFFSQSVEGKCEIDYTLTSVVEFDGVEKNSSSSNIRIAATKFVMDTGPINYAADLKDEEYYIIRLKNVVDYRFWTNNSNYGFELWAKLNGYGIELNDELVFQFHKGTGTHPDYKSSCKGKWMSFKTKKFLTWTNDTSISFSAASESDGFEVMIANRWGSDTDQYMDIYKGNGDLMDDFLCRNNTKKLAWGLPSDTGERKWEIVKVILYP